MSVAVGGVGGSAGGAVQPADHEGGLVGGGATTTAAGRAAAARRARWRGGMAIDYASICSVANATKMACFEAGREIMSREVLRAICCRL